MGLPLTLGRPRARGAKEVTAPIDPVYRRGVRRGRRFCWLFAALRGAGAGAIGATGATGGAGCTAKDHVDPGSNPVIPDEIFDADYFFCHVEPELLFAKKCGSGDPGDNNACHFSSSAVSGMAIASHPPVACASSRPVDRAQLGAGSSAQGNLQAATLAMSRDYLTAPIYLRPTGQNHPRKIFEPNDPVVEVIKTWAQK